MNLPLPDEKYVYHGSHESFDVVIPKRQRRIRNGQEIFNDISFHATPYKWIALAYTCKQKPYLLQDFGGKKAHYGMGVSLYDHNLEVEIYGFESLEKSLEAIYGDGGFLFTFAKDTFFHTEGLGNLEVITKDSITPIKVERIDDPVAEMKKEGVKFTYYDLAKEENEKFRNCY